MQTNTRKLLSTLLVFALVFSLFAAMPVKANAATEMEANSCEIGGVKYSLFGAISAVPTGGSSPTVIKLLANISTGPTISIDNKKIIFNLNGKELHFKQLDVKGASIVDYIGAGQFIAERNVTDGSAGYSYPPLLVTDNSSCTLTGAKGSISPEGDASLIVCTRGSKVTVNGSVSGSANGGGQAVSAGQDSVVTVNGNITMNAAFKGSGARAYMDSKVVVSGNINVPGGIGAGASNNSTVTVEGTITAQTYAEVFNEHTGAYVKKTINDYTAISTLSGYRTYAEGDSTVWVKEPTPAVAITQQPSDKTVKSGEDATFSITVIGSSPITFQWQYFHDDPILQDWADLPENSSNSGVKTRQLTLYNNTFDPVYEQNNTVRLRCKVTGSGTTVYSNEAKLTIIQIVIDPTITGPTTMTLQAGYAATSTAAYTMTGEPAPTVVKVSGDAAIKWNYTTNKLDIAAGLAPGSYPVELMAGNGFSYATLIFTLTVTPAPSAGGSMNNFQTVNTYVIGMFTDVNENAWYGFYDQKVIALAYEYGLMTGNSATTFNPTGNMSVAEAITVATRVHCYYMTGQKLVFTPTPGATWYQGNVDYAIAEGIIKATDFTNYTRAITRAEMAYIFSRCLPAAEFPAQNTVNSLPDVNNNTPYRNEIFMLYKAGVVQGSGTPGTFYPANNIIRAEAAAIISRVILPLTRFSGRTFGA